MRDGDTALGGKIPVNVSGGLACFGEAVPAQALAQVCELTWQLRGQAGDRQVEGAKVGITANQGLFGHGSSVIVKASYCTREFSALAHCSRTDACCKKRDEVRPALRVGHTQTHHAGLGKHGHGFSSQAYISCGVHTKLAALKVSE